MKAVLMHEPGAPDVLQPGEVTDPDITTPTGVRVRIEAAGINPIDTKLRSRGTYFPDRMPAILGCDGAGVVEAVGDQVTRFAPGDAVFWFNGGIGGDPGSYAEYTVVDETRLARKPGNISFAEAAAAPLVTLTAWEALHDRARMGAGQRVLIHAGTGGVGHVAIQLAKAAGCQVITTVSTEEKAERARQLGADETVLYRETDFAEAVLAWSGGQGVDIALDTVGGAVFEQSFAAVRPYGDLVSLLQPAEVDWKIARLRNLRTSLELMLSPQFFGWEEACRHQTWILEQAAAMLEEGSLKMQISHQLPLAEAAEAHRLIEAGGMTGKIVLTRESDS